MHNTLKEKGAENSTQDSVKNQHKYTKKSNILPTLINQFETGLYKRFNYLTDPILIKENYSLINEFKHLKLVASNDPRLPWQIIQSIIDNTWRHDKQLKGVNVKIIFNELKGDLNNFNPENIKGFS